MSNPGINASRAKIDFAGFDSTTPCGPMGKITISGSGAEWFFGKTRGFHGLGD